MLILCQQKHDIQLKKWYYMFAGIEREARCAVFKKYGIF